MTNDYDDNSQTGLNYELLVEEALRSVVRSSLRIVENVGLPGETHFYIGFITGHEGVELEEALRSKHTDQMTIVIQHQYADLIVDDDHFSITLFFGGKPSPMIIPFQAVTSFNDPSVGFGLQFGMLEEDGDNEDCAADTSIKAVDKKTDLTVKKVRETISEEKSAKDEKTAEVVSLDTFRKRPTS